MYPLLAGLLASSSARLITDAAALGKVDEVLSMIRAGEARGDERIESHPWSTSLMLAASRRRVAVLRALLTSGADPNLRDADGQTALMMAATSGLEESVTVLLAAGADVNAQDVFGDSALSAATKRGHAHIVRLLLAGGADPNLLPDTCMSILSLAVQQCHVGVVEALVQAGAVGSVHDSTPAAQDRAELDSRSVLTPVSPPNAKRCADLPPLPPMPALSALPARCMPPAPIDLPVGQLFALHEQLTLASMNQQELRPSATGAVLSAVGPDGSAPTSEASAPLAREASEERRVRVSRAARLAREVVEALLGVPPLASGEAAAVPSKLHELLGSLATSVDRGAPARSALQLAAAHNLLPALKRLLGAGAQADARSPLDGATALMLALANGHAAATQVLLSAKASVTAIAHSGALVGMNALHLAAWRGHAELVASLVAASPAALQQPTHAGARRGPAMSALMLASWAGHSEVVKELLRAGADPHVRWQGLSALDLAREALEKVDGLAKRALGPPLGTHHVAVIRRLIKVIKPGARGSTPDASATTSSAAAAAGASGATPSAVGGHAGAPRPGNGAMPFEAAPFEPVSSVVLGGTLSSPPSWHDPTVIRGAALTAVLGVVVGVLLQGGQLLRWVGRRLRGMARALVRQKVSNPTQPPRQPALTERKAGTVSVAHILGHNKLVAAPRSPHSVMEPGPLAPGGSSHMEFAWLDAAPPVGVRGEGDAGSAWNVVESPNRRKGRKWIHDEEDRVSTTSSKTSSTSSTSYSKEVHAIGRPQPPSPTGGSRSSPKASPKSPPPLASGPSSMEPSLGGREMVEAALTASPSAKALSASASGLSGLSPTSKPCTNASGFVLSPHAKPFTPATCVASGAAGASGTAGMAGTIDAPFSHTEAALLVMGFDVALARRAATATAHSSLEVQIEWIMHADHACERTKSSEVQIERIMHADLGESSGSGSNGGNGAASRGGAKGDIRTIAVAVASAGGMCSSAVGLGAGALRGSSGKGKARMGEAAANGTGSIAASRDCPISPVGAAYVPPDCSDC